ncbi:LDAP Interacting Protein [Hibiscus trionum]|uniref:LDAP Interacting Protein n=1 Tax=Hibiscus trionum TaxID=183268 RepID=A0A9W7LGR9_HIBTR|nr:LDAP Interacting Protein [Hibiscus trionum]
MAEQLKGATVDENNCTRREETLLRLVSSIIYPEASAPLLQRIKVSVSENVARLGEASRNTSRSVLPPPCSSRHFCWERYISATVNAMIISFLIALAAAGGFLATFFACVTLIYIAAFVISTATISAIIAAGWVGFFWALCLGAKKSMHLAKHSALSPYSSAHRYQQLNKLSD